MDNKDLSEAIAQIQGYLKLMGLTFQSDRVQTWLNQAGAKYCETTYARGEIPFSPPPYPSLAWVPDELVIGLAKALRKAWETANRGDSHPTHPSTSVGVPTPTEAH